MYAQRPHRVPPVAGGDGRKKSCSGSTGKAARLEGFRFVGIERDANYFVLANQRIFG